MAINSFVGQVNVGENESKVGSTLFGTCNSAASSYDKYVIIPGLDAILPGMTIHVQFTNTHSPATVAEVFLSIYLSGGRIIRYPLKRYGVENVGNTTDTSWQAGAVVSMTFNGTYWVMNDWNADTNTTYGVVTTASNGLMLAADKAKIDALGVIMKSSITVEESDWTADSTYSGYGFKASIAVTGCTASHIPTVTFTPGQIETYNPAPVADSSAGVVAVYVMVKPATDIVIPSIQLIKGAEA